MWIDTVTADNSGLTGSRHYCLLWLYIVHLVHAVDVVPNMYGSPCAVCLFNGMCSPAVAATVVCCVDLYPCNPTLLSLVLNHATLYLFDHLKPAKQAVLQRNRWPRETFV